jgi:basic membrane protein A and related proteins
VKVRRNSVAVVAALIVALVAALGLTAGSGTASSHQTTFQAALVSDVGRFNDKSFNQSQLQGLLRAKAQLKIKALPLQSNSDADYIPNLTTAVRRGSNAVVCAGFLMADACAKIVSRSKNVQFAITDYPVQIAPFANAKGKILYPNVTGLTYASQESGCLVGYMAALMAKRAGGKQVIGAVGGIKIPPVDTWIAGYKYCAKRANKAITVLIGYSQDFVQSDKCKAVAEQQIAQGAKVLFQVAGGCGLGTLKAADEAGKWGIGVDVDQYKLAKRVLTSAVKRVDTGVYDAIQQVKQGKWNGGHDLVFNLKNGGMGVGKISPKVPSSFITLMNQYKSKIIAGTLKVPSSV